MEQIFVLTIEHSLDCFDTKYYKKQGQYKFLKSMSKIFSDVFLILKLFSTVNFVLAKVLNSK